MINFVCEFCNENFTAKRHRRGCTGTCSASLSWISGQVLWREQESAKLEQLAETMPLAELIECIQQYQKKCGWPERTADAIKAKLQREGYSKRTKLDNFTISELARLLGITRDRARTWIVNHALPFRKVGHFIAISLLDFRAWARRNVGQLSGIEADRLNWLIADIEFCKRAQDSPRPGRGRSQPVLNVTTGKHYESIRAASRAIKVTEVSLQQALKRGYSCSGSKWHYADSLGNRD